MLSVDDCTPHLEQRMTKSRSLSKMSLSSAGSANYHLHRELSYSLEDSEDDDESETNVIYSPALLREPSPDEVPPQVKSKFMTKTVVMITCQTDVTFVIMSLFKCKAIETKVHYTSIT